MRIFGLDFTSSPKKSKPITIASCSLMGENLVIENIQFLSSTQALEDFLKTKGPWIAGIDFPFGEPQKFIQGINFPNKWEDYVIAFGNLSSDEFVALVNSYRATRQPGDKHHYRQTDRLAGALSPMMVYGIPVGRMFHLGAPKLLESHASILPCRWTNADRILVETYPALVARRLNSRMKYKNEARDNQDLVKCRQWIISQIRLQNLRREFNLTIQINDHVAHQCVQDHKGDNLDAVLSSIQAAWAYMNYPALMSKIDLASINEGWIMDPKIIPGK